MSENKLRIKTLPTQANSNFIIPVVTSEAVQGNFPEPEWLGDKSSTDLYQFLEKIITYLGKIDSQTENKIKEIISSKFNLSEDTVVDVSQLVFKDALDAKINELNAKISSAIPSGTIIKKVGVDCWTYNPESETPLTWNAGVLDLSQVGGWELLSVQETLTYTYSTTLSRGGRTSNSAHIGTIYDVYDLFKKKYSDYIPPDEESPGTSWFDFEFSDGGKKVILHSGQENNPHARIYGSVINGDADTAPDHIETLQDVKGNIYVTWDRDTLQDNKISDIMRFNIEFRVTRPCFTWRKK